MSENTIRCTGKVSEIKFRGSGVSAELKFTLTSCAKYYDVEARTWKNRRTVIFRVDAAGRVASEIHEALQNGEEVRIADGIWFQDDWGDRITLTSMEKISRPMRPLPRQEQKPSKAQAPASAATEGDLVAVPVLPLDVRKGDRYQLGDREMVISHATRTEKNKVEINFHPRGKTSPLEPDEEIVVYRTTTTSEVEPQEQVGAETPAETAADGLPPEEDATMAGAVEALQNGGLTTPQTEPTVPAKKAPRQSSRARKGGS